MQRAVTQIVKRLKENNQHGQTTRLTMNCYEIYIENVRDLLDPTNEQAQLMTNQKWSPYEMEVRDESDIYSVLEEAFKN